jgi:hypothetical protein
VTEKHDRGFPGQGEKPPMEFRSVSRFKIYGLMAKIHPVRGHIEFGLGVEHKKIFDLGIKKDENNNPRQRNQDDRFFVNGKHWPVFFHLSIDPVL